MRVLGIETSCDETGVAVFDTARGLLAHRLHSQVDLHARYGGVVPELASRDHVRRLVPLIEEVAAASGTALADLDGIAYTEGPGLAGALLVGASVANALGMALGKPVVGIHHLEGHLLSPLLADPRPDFPFVALLVSGGHSQLFEVAGVGRYRLIGDTLDDAAGEAFDKVARLLGLGFPGGPAIQQAAGRGDAARFRLPRALLRDAAHRFDFSFSGLKTAVLNLVRQLEENGESLDPAGQGAQLVADLAASFQAAVTDVLVDKLAAAAVEQRAAQVCICGGVSANAALRFAARARFEEMGLPLYIPPLFLCTDNAAMIGAAAFFRHQADGPAAAEGLGLDVAANLPLA